MSLAAALTLLRGAADSYVALNQGPQYQLIVLALTGLAIILSVLVCLSFCAGCVAGAALAQGEVVGAIQREVFGRWRVAERVLEPAQARLRQLGHYRA